MHWIPSCDKNSCSSKMIFKLVKPECGGGIQWRKERTILLLLSEKCVQNFYDNYKIVCYGRRMEGNEDFFLSNMPKEPLLQKNPLHH